MNEQFGLPPGFELEPSFDPVAGAVAPMLAGKKPAAAAAPSAALPPGFELLPDGFVLEDAPGAPSMAGMDAPMPPPRPADLDTGLNVPEPPATIAAQQAQVGKGTGTGARNAVMFPQGSQEPDLPEDWSRITTPRGVFHYDPSQIKASRIRELSAQGKENEILGLGPVSKPDADKRVAQGEQPVTVVERQPDGTEVKAAVGTPSTVDAQKKALEKGKLPGSTIEVEQPLSTAMRRVAQNPPMPPARPADLGATAAPEASEFAPTQPVPALGFDIDPEAQAQRDNTRQVNKDGTTFGMLTPAQGFKEFDDRVAGAEEGLRKADERLKVAEDRAKLLANLPKGARGSQSELQRQAIEQEYANATDARIAARKGLAAAKAIPAPSMTATRSALEGGAQRALEMPVGALGGLGRPIDAILGTDIGGAADRERTRIEGSFKGDVGRKQDFGQELAEGAGSMVGFIMGGAVGRAAGLSQKATSIGIGGFQNADEMYREAEKAGATGWKKAAAYIAGGGVGMTEGFGSGRLLDHMAGVDKATNGGVRRYFGLVLKNKGEEALQEAVQSLGNDLAKLGVLGIDPGDMTENALKNAFLGAILGGSTAAVLGSPMAISGRGLRPEDAIGDLPGVGDAPVRMGAGFQYGQPLESPRGPVPPQEDIPPETQVTNAADPAANVTSPAPPPGFEIEPGPTATPSPTAPVQGEAPQPAQEAATDDTRLLRAAGYSDEDIADMSPPERMAALDEARAEGVTVPGPIEESPKVPNVNEPGLLPEATVEGPTPGTRSAPVKVESEADLEAVRPVVNAEPTPAQAAAGNYRHAHVKFDGFDVSIENPAGSTRRGTDTDGESWESVMPPGLDYGYIKRTTGKDGDNVDVFLGPQGPTGQAFVIEQIDPKTGKFDELKIFMGVQSADEARDLYGKVFSDGSGPSRIGDLVPMSADQVREWLDKGGGKGRVPKRYRGQAGAIQAGQENNTPAPAPEFTPLAQAQPGDLVEKGKELVERGLSSRDAVKLARETKGAGIVPDGNRWAVIAPPERAKVRTGLSTRDKEGRPLSLVAFLRKEGGIRDQRGELRSRDMHRAYPGLVNNKRGLTLDMAREMAAEAGYLSPTEALGLSYTDGAVATTRINDLLDALDNHPTYSVRDEQAVADAAAERDGKEIQSRIDEMRDALKADLLTLGFAERDISDRILTLAAEAVVDGSQEFELAYENAVMLDFRDEVDTETQPNEPDIPWDRIDEPAIAVEDAAQVREEPAAEGYGAGDRAPAEGQPQDDEYGTPGGSADGGPVSTQETGDDNRDADEVATKSAKAKKPSKAEVAAQKAEQEAETAKRREERARERAERIELITRETERHDGESDDDYFIRLYRAFHNDYQNREDGKGGWHVEAREVIHPILDSLSTLEKITVPIQKAARWKAEIDLRRVPFGWISGYSYDGHEKGGGGGASSLWFYKNSIFDTREAAAWHEVDAHLKRMREDERAVKAVPAVEKWAKETFGERPAETNTEEAEAPAEQDGEREADIQAEDSNETVRVRLTRDGPWDFNDTWPDVDAEQLRRLAVEGRDPFGNDGELPSVESVVYTLTETMGEIESAVAQQKYGRKVIADLNAGRFDGYKTARTEKGREELRKKAQADMKQGSQNTLDLAGEVANLFGRKAAAAMVRHARQMIETETSQRPQGAQGYANAADKPTEPTTEKGADGKPQTVIPGAEQIGDGKLAQIKADAPLKPKAQQKDVGGLFGDSMDQADLMDLANAPPKAPEPKVEAPVTARPEWSRPTDDIVDEIDGFKIGDAVDVPSKTIDRSIVEGLFYRDIIAGKKTAMAYIREQSSGKALSVNLSTLEKARPAEESPAAAAPVSDNAVVEAFRLHFASPEGSFRTIIEARKFANENGFKPVDGVPANKQIEELIEHALVLAARDIIAASKNRGAETVYNRLVDLYNRQPKLGSRTSTSVSEQAYSTPMPLAFLASRLADIATPKTVYEPSAGNGALLMESVPDRAIANEINPIRRANLEAQGFLVTGYDATDPASKPTFKTDVVIANPPFGAVRENGESKVWKIGDFASINIDHIISLRALDNMLPDGRAVLIIGGIKADSEKERSKGYTGSAKRKFFFRLMNEYNVTDIFTVDGDLYERQGAGWPVDVIVIEGKGKSARKPPTADVPRLFKSWDELKEKLDGHGFGEASPRSQGVAGQDERPAGEIAGAGRRPASDDGLSGGPLDVGEPAVDIAPEGFDPGVDAQLPAGEPGNVLGEQRPGNGARADQRADIRDGGSLDPEPDSDVDGLNDAPVESKATGQAAYKPSSKRGVALNTLVPTNLATVTRDSLRRVEEAHGKVDTYVARELGYKVEDLGQYFSAEQIDAIALAMDNIEKGAGFIIGDQTGIGKGRVVAAAIRYAHKKGMTPLFVTEKPDLYGDMWRDLHDIGFDKYLGRPIEMFMTNSGVRVPLDDEAVSWSAERDAAKETGEKAPPQRGTFSTPQDTKKAAAKMREILAGSYKPDVVFTTYDQMNSVAGKETDRRAFLGNIAPSAFLIMDETHNAGGGGNEGWEAKDKAPPRSKIFREAVDKAQAVLYSSATYAKSPKVMDLFSRTDMSLAVEDKEKLPELIASGGVPLQQAVSSMLARSGQYLRRERSFEGITYDVEAAPVDLMMYGNFSTGLRNIFQFDLMFAKDRQEIADQIAAELGAGTARDGGVGDAAANTTAFASIMHNAVNQMVLSIKARAAGQRAIEALKAGEKPVIALSATMETFITDAAEAADINFGDAITLDFGDVLKRYLERTRRVTITMPDDTKKHVMIPLEQMPTHLLDMYNRAMDFLNGLDFSQMPISPIDYIRNEITRAGYSVREITGRDTMVDYGSGNAPIYAQRAKSEQGVTGKRVSIKDFNEGKLDVLILNRSGSTGVSLHAKKGFKDVRKRRMILVQADPNIDTHMQMLGRVNRTGQVVPPAYTQLMADIPAEARPAAVLLKKMASLNANTTASRKGALSGDTVDFINEYGDQVVAMALAEDSQTNALMNYPLKDNDGTKKAEGIAAKATGKLALLKPIEQQAFLDRVTEAYTQLIDTLDKAGENKLEAKNIDLQTITEETTSLKPATGPSPFQASVDLEKVSAKAQGRAMAPDDVLDAAREALGLKEIPTRYGADDGFNRLAALADEGRRKFADLKTRMAEEHAQHKRALLGGMKDLDAKGKAEAKEDANFARWESIASLAKIGAVIDYETSQGGDTAVVIGFSRAAKAKSPLALSAWTLTLAVPNSSRTIGIPLSQVYTGAFPLPDGGAGVTISIPVRATPYTELGDRFEEARKEGRETRYIVTGNILAGFEQTKGKGQIVSYTTADGQVRQGILMSRKFEPAEFFKDKGVRFKSGAQVIEFVNRVRDSEVLSADSIITVRAVTNYRTNAKSIEFELPSAKGKGGVYFTDKTLRAVFDGWEKRGTKMRADVNPDLAGRMIDAMMQIGAKFVATDNLEEARAITGEAAPETMKAPPTPPARAMAAPRAEYTQAATDAGLSQAHTLQVITDIVRQVVGRYANVTTADTLMIGGQKAAGGWYASEMLVAVALDASNNRREVAYHEAFHALQTLGAFSDQEISLLEREAPRHRAIAEANWRRRFGVGFPSPLPVGETSAYAFGAYAESREAGSGMPLHIGVRRAFDKALEILRRIRNYFEGLGFRTSEDIFAQAFEGGYRNNVDLSRSWDQPAQAARLWNEGPGARAMAAPPMRKQRDRSLVSKGSDSWVDRHVRQRELEREFQRDSGQQPVQVYRMLGALNTRIADRIEDLRDKELDQVLTAAQPLTLDQSTVQALEAINPDINLSDGERILHRFLLVRHAEERNDYVAAKNLKMQDAGSGVPTAQAQAELAAFMADPASADLIAAAQTVYDMIAADMAERVASGLYSQQQATNIQSSFQHYVPLRGFDHDEFEPGGPQAGSGLSLGRSEHKTAMGRSSEADSIIAQTVMMRRDGIVRAQKNLVDKALFRLAGQMQAHYGAQSPLKARTQAPLTRVESGGQVVDVPDRNYGDRPNVIVAKINGKPRYIEFDGELDLVAELKNAVIHRDDFTIQAVGKGTSFLGSLWTWRYLFFPPVNFVRDYLDATTAAAAMLGARGVARYHANLASGRSLRESILYQIGKETPEFNRFRMAGGRMSWSTLTDIEQIDKEIAEAINGVPGWKKVPRLVGRLLTAQNDILENTHRYALYKAALDIGLPEAAAVRVSLEGTMNFHRRGSGGGARLARTIYPFFNPSVQAPMRAKRLIEEAGGLTTGGGAAVVAGMAAKGFLKTYFAYTVLGVLVGFSNYIVGGDDDDETPFWDKAQWNPQSRKSIMIYTGGKDEKGRPNTFMIPAFPEIMAPFHIGNALAASIMGKQKSVDIAKQIGATLYQMSPTEGRGAVPALFAPIREIIDNKNHFGSPVHPSETPYTRGVPAPERKFSTTDEGWQALARALHAGTGKKLNLHPEDYRHVARSYLGGYYQVAEWAASLSGVSVSDRGDPLTKRFFLPGDRGVDSYERDKFKEGEAQANEKRFAIRQSIADPANVGAREQRRAAAQNASNIREQGGVVGRQGGISTPQTEIFDTGRQVMSSIAKQRDAAVAKAPDATTKAKIRQDYTERMAVARKKYRSLADDLTAGKVKWEAIQRDLAIAKRDARNPRAQ